MIKKIVTALLVLGALASAHAQTNTGSVSIYGRVSTYYDNDKVGALGSVNKITDDVSRIGFRGQEDLGGGARAYFQVETSLGLDTAPATSLGNRVGIVGLSNKLGGVELGRQHHSIWRTLANYDPLGNLYGTTAASVHNAQGNRFGNQVQVYATPFETVKAAYQKSFSEVPGGADGNSWQLEGKLGGVNATVAGLDNGAGNTSTIYGAKYTVKATGTTLLALYSEDKVGAVETQGKTIGVNQRVAPNVVLLAGYGENQLVKSYAAGATYELSKRTRINARYLNEDNVVAAKDRKQFGVGIEHVF